MNKTKKIIIFVVLICLCLLIVIVKVNKKICVDCKVPVLMYHSIQDEIKGTEKWIVRTKDFEEQMKYLYDHNYKTIFIEDIEKVKKGSKSIAITFDDGYEDFYTNVFPIIKKYNIKTNLYIITDHIGSNKFLNEEQIKEIASSGLVSIGSHTDSHKSLNSLDTKTLKKELKESKDKLEDLINKKIKTIVYPYGIYDRKVNSATKKYYKYALSIQYEIQDMKDFDRYKIKRMAIYGYHDLNKFKSIVKETV